MRKLFLSIIFSFTLIFEAFGQTASYECKLNNDGNFPFKIDFENWKVSSYHFYNGGDKSVRATFKKPFVFWTNNFISKNVDGHRMDIYYFNLYTNVLTQTRVYFELMDDVHKKKWTSETYYNCLSK